MADPDNVTVALSIDKDAAPNGAGWLLPDGDIITCAHVVAGWKKVCARPIGPSADFHEYYVYERQGPRRGGAPSSPYEGDLALLKPVKPTGKAEPAAKYRPRLPRQGEEVVAFGFPAVNPAGQSGYGRMGTASSVGRREVMEADRKEHILVQGFSGAPVVSTERPNVLGIFVSTLEPAARGYVIPPQLISAWLSGIDPKTTFFGAGTEWPSSALRKIRKAVFGDNPPNEDFEIRVCECAGGSATPPPRRALAYGDGDRSPEDLVSIVDSDETPILLLAKGGGGKSSFLVDMAMELEEAGIDFLWLDLKKLKAQEGVPGWDALFAQPNVDPSELMTAICTPACEVSGWGEKLGGNGQLVIIADGVNEVGKGASRLLQALESYVGYRADARLVATARTTTKLDAVRNRRTFLVSPLPDEIIERATGKEAARLGDNLLNLLSNPQMLGIAIAIANFDAVRPSEMFRRYFEVVLDKAREARPGCWIAKAPHDFLLDVLCLLSFDILRNAGATLAIREDDWNQRLKQSVAECVRRQKYHAIAVEPVDPDLAGLTDELVERGVLTLTGAAGTRTVSFQHALYQEWLAARHFVNLHPLKWTNAGFMAITLEDSSDDALRLSVQLVQKRLLDVLMLYMYDWRWQRVLNLSAEGIPGLPVELEDAFIGLNALRLLDPFSHTREAVEPAISRRADSGDEFAASLLEAAASGSEADLLALVRQRFAGVKFDSDKLGTLNNWRALLDLPSPADVDAVVALVFDDPFVGWSASNILRVTGVTPRAATALYAAYAASHTTAASPVEDGSGFYLVEAGVGLRWRIVHTLGAALPEKSLGTGIEWLRGIWRDDAEHQDVRFGACRSLMEIALAHPKRRPAIFEAFIESLTEWSQTKGKDAKWRGAALKASEQLWRASRPAPGVLNPKAGRAWNSSLREVLEAAKKTAEAMEWPAEALDDTLEALRRETEDGDSNDG